MSIAAVVGLATLALALFTHTAILFRWGSRLQLLVEQHEEQVNGEKGLRRWKHDVVNMQLQDHEARLTAIEQGLHNG